MSWDSPEEQRVLASINVRTVFDHLGDEYLGDTANHWECRGVGVIQAHVYQHLDSVLNTQSSSYDERYTYSLESSALEGRTSK